MYVPSCWFSEGYLTLWGQYTSEKDVEDVQYISFLLMARAGIRALEFYDPVTKKHGQAHMQARYASLFSSSPTPLTPRRQPRHHPAPLQVRHRAARGGARRGRRDRGRTRRDRRRRGHHLRRALLARAVSVVLLLLLLLRGHRRLRARG